MPFIDRVEAGRELACRLAHLRGEDVVVAGLPRGGVPIAAEIAEALDAPLEVIMVRGLSVPFQPELTMGAIGEDGARTINDAVVREAGIHPRELAVIERVERRALDRRGWRLRGGRPPLPLGGRVVVIVDDGMASGATARVACQVARTRGARPVIVAVPVAAPETIAEVSADADEVVCVEAPLWLWTVGQCHAGFGRTTDEEVSVLLADTPLPVPDPAGRNVHPQRTL